MVELEGYSVRVMTGGFEHLERGRPVVVLESGAGASIGNWGPVFQAVAAFAPVVAYERGGIGESEWDGQPPIPERRTERLHGLLALLEAPPPYVLVGHSWGGYLVRYFAGRYPDELVGLVYVDPTDFTHRHAEELAALREIGVADGEAALEAMDRASAYYTSRLPPAIAAEYAVVDSLMEKVEPEERGLLPAPDVPLAILLGARYREPPPRPPGIEFGFEFRDLFQARTAQRVRKMSAWALEAREGLFVVATHASHLLHRDDPDLLIDAIRRVVFPDVARQLREALAEGGRQAMVDAYHALERRYPPERFDEDRLNALGYGMLQARQVKNAIAVFELNVEEYPDLPNPHDSLGDAYRTAGRLEEAKRSHERAVELAEEQGHPSLATYQANLERVTQQLEEK